MATATPARQGAVLNFVITGWSHQAFVGLFGFGPTDLDAGWVLPAYGDVRRPAAVRPAEVGHGDGVGPVVAGGSVDEQVVVLGLLFGFDDKAGVLVDAATGGLVEALPATGSKDGWD